MGLCLKAKQSNSKWNAQDVVLIIEICDFSLWQITFTNRATVNDAVPML